MVESPCVTTWNWCRDRAGQCHDRARATGAARARQGTMARDGAQCSHDPPIIVQYVMHCLGTVYRHCSQGFQKFKFSPVGQKKKRRLCLT